MQREARRLPAAPPAETLAAGATAPSSRVGLQVGFRRAEIAALAVGDLHQNRGFDALRVTRKGGRREALAINPRAQRIRAYFELAGRRAAVQAAVRQRQAARYAGPHGPGHHRPAGAEICEADRPGSRLLGAFDARDLHHHGAGERRPAGGRQKAAGHRDPSTTKLYDRRGYNPEKAASFFATY
jgi:hypothetical protein